MLKGLYAAGTGMITHSQKIDVLANNIANVESSGFKKDDLSIASFGDQLHYNIKTSAPIGNTPSGVTGAGVTANLEQGPCEQTGLPTDLAILSEGFFAVQGTGGVEYTRNGGFTIDAEGYLALPAGQRLMGSSGPLQVGGDGFTVAPDGSVQGPEGEIGKIPLYNTADPRTVVKGSDGLFDLPGAQAVNGSIRQGYLEGSNVDMISEMTGLMASTRAFQSCQQAFKVSDQSEQLAVNQVGALK
jgi:flagellar basal-body rod protein FlgG